MAQKQKKTGDFFDQIMKASFDPKNPAYKERMARKEKVFFWLLPIYLVLAYLALSYAAQIK